MARTMTVVWLCSDAAGFLPDTLSKLFEYSQQHYAQNINEYTFW